MTGHSARVLVGLLASSVGGLLVACATQADLRTTSRDLLSKNEELRSELKEARQRSAEVETSLREIKGQDLSQMLGQLETQRRDVETLQSALDDQKAQVYSLEKKLRIAWAALRSALRRPTGVWPRWPRRSGRSGPSCRPRWISRPGPWASWRRRSNTRTSRCERSRRRSIGFRVCSQNLIKSSAH